MGLKEYRLYIYNHNGIIHKTHRMSMVGVIRELCKRLHRHNAKGALKLGQFVTTKLVVGESFVIKRYVVHTTAPVAKYIIMKESKGSIDTDMFLSTINYYKGD